jgi:glutamate dehydrogenase (NAD(P)+)
LSEKSNNIRVLLIEGNKEHARHIREFLSGKWSGSFDLECCNLLSSGLKRFARGGIDVVLIDVRLPDSRVSDTINWIGALATRVPIIVLTDAQNESQAKEAAHAGARCLVTERMDADALTGEILSLVRPQRQ